MCLNKNEYKKFLNQILQEIGRARIETARTMNKGLITLYQNIGKIIVERQEQFGWGKSVVEQLAKDLEDRIPGQKGFSPRNLWEMRKLAL